MKSFFKLIRNNRNKLGCLNEWMNFFPNFMEKSLCHIWFSFPSHLKKITLRFWLEKIKIVGFSRVPIFFRIYILSILVSRLILIFGCQGLKTSKKISSQVEFIKIREGNINKWFVKYFLMIKYLQWYPCVVTTDINKKNDT